MGDGKADHGEGAPGAGGLLDQLSDVGMQEAVAVQPGQAIIGRGKAAEAAAQMTTQPLLAHPGLNAQAQHLGVEGLEQHVRHAPGEGLCRVREVLAARHQEHWQVEQLGVAAHRRAQALQLLVSVASGDQRHVQIVATQALDGGVGSLGVGGGGRAAKSREDLDLIAAGWADQENADALDRGHAGTLRPRGHAEMRKQGIAASPLDLHTDQARESTHTRLQLGVRDRQHEHVVSAESERVRRNRRGLLRGGDDDGQMTRSGVRFELREQRQAILDPGVDHDYVDALSGESRRGALVAGARDRLAAPLAQPGANRLERLVGTLQHKETGGLSHARYCSRAEP